MMMMMMIMMTITIIIIILYYARWQHNITYRCTYEFWKKWQVTTMTL